MGAWDPRAQSSARMGSTITFTMMLLLLSASAADQLLPLKDEVFDLLEPTLTIDYKDLYATIYQPRGYSVCFPRLPYAFWLPLHISVNCAALFKQYLVDLEVKPVWPPPRTIPTQMLDEYLLNGYSRLVPWYIAQVGGDGSAVHVWTPKSFQPYLDKAVRKAGHSYPTDDPALYGALDSYFVKGQTAAVFGSQDPWVEAMLFTAGASHVTTIEYYKTESLLPNHTAITPKTWAQSWLDGKIPRVDVAVSFSSHEHDGLGRYGDPLSPWADVIAMQRVSCYVKAGGLFFLTVPMTAHDAIAYNAHRIYGPARWPLMSANWHVEAVLMGQAASFFHPKIRMTNMTREGLWSYLKPHLSDAAYKAQNVVVVMRNEMEQHERCTVGRLDYTASS